MARSDRLFDILTLLRDGTVHTAQSLAQKTGVSPRTLYRDMDSLAASGVPVTGTRGTGYQLAALITLPPLSLTTAELEALELGLAIAAEVADPQMRYCHKPLLHRRMHGNLRLRPLPIPRVACRISRPCAPP